MRLSTLVSGAGSLALAVSLTAAPAQAHRPPPGPQVVTDGLAGPLTLAVGDRDLYVTQSFAGTLSKVDKRGRVRTIHQLQLPPDAGELVGVAHDRGSTYHVETDYSGASGPTSHIVRTSSKGKRTIVSDDLMAYEAAKNPDGRKRYGFRGLDADCSAELAELETQIGAPLNDYKGIVESHPYQLDVHRGSIFVADAAANAVLKVNARTGAISTVAVIPATSITFGTELEGHLEETLGTDVPDCLRGARYTPEPVPTDVEADRRGGLYVSTLQGLAGESLPLSKVYRVKAHSGRSHEVARGMRGATGLAVARNGNIFVSEMFGGQVSVVRPGSSRARQVFAAESPADVEVRGHTLYATTNTFTNGTIVKYEYHQRRHHHRR